MAKLEADLYFRPPRWGRWYLAVLIMLQRRFGHRIDLTPLINRAYTYWLIVK